MEKGIHRALKLVIQEDIEKQEVPLAGYMIDAITEDGILHEVQSQKFYRIKEKLADLLEQGYKVNLVYPIATTKQIQWVDTDGTFLELRKSPKKMKPIHVLAELYGLPDEVLKHEHFQCTIYELDTVEYKIQDGYGVNKRSRATKYEQEISQINRVTIFDNYKKYMELLEPITMKDFTVVDFASYRKVKKEDGQKILKLLHRLEMIEREKQGKAYIYNWISC